MTDWQYPNQHVPRPTAHPPAKKKRLVWPWILGLVVVAVMAVPVGMAMSLYLNLLPDTREVAVTVEVMGSATSARVEVDRGAGSEPETMEVDIPWRAEFTVAGDGKHVSVIGWPGSKLNSLSCRIIADGKTIAEDSIVGGHWHIAPGMPTASTAPRRPPNRPPTADGPPPHSDVMPALVLPVGSTAEANSDGKQQKRWNVPTRHADTVQHLRAQLPVGFYYDGLPFCIEGIGHELTIWCWGTKADYVTVLVSPSGLTTGSEVSISREPYTDACGR